MLESVRGVRPEITAAQGLAAMIAGIPILANTVRSFGVGGTSKQEVDALHSAVAWSAVVAGTLIGADALMRATRYSALAKTEAMAMAPIGPMEVTLDELDFEDAEASSILDDELPDDDQELATPPPAAVS